MYEVAMFFSIVSSVLFCIYLLMCIFGTSPKQSNQIWLDNNQIIEIRGQIVTRTITYSAGNVDNASPVYTMHRTIEHR